MASAQASRHSSACLRAASAATSALPTADDSSATDRARVSRLTRPAPSASATASARRKAGASSSPVRSAASPRASSSRSSSSRSSARRV
ncbi:hypothetical protein DSECCO2_646230 [anaerobic digester metagenome]